MGILGSAVEFLNLHGFFTALAYFLLFIILFYGFLYLLKEKIKKQSHRQLLSILMAVPVTAILYFTFAAYAADSAAFLSVLAVAIAVIFMLVAATIKLAGIDATAIFRK